MKRPAAGTLMLGLSTLVALTAVELGLRASGAFAVDYGWPPEVAGGAASQDGAAGDDAPGALRILLLGDSQVLNPGTEPGRLPALLLEDALNAELRTTPPLRR